MPSLAALSPGYHVVAMDQRGYGRTYHPNHPKPIPAGSFRPTTLIKDTLHIIAALGYPSAACIAGHDFGAVTATLCSLSRPDIFHSCVLLSHPFKGAPILNYTTPKPPPVDMEASLRALPRPRKHYKWYYCTPPANADMTHPTGPPLHTFLRGYFHLKSGDWAGNSPHPLSSWTASELEKMPRYYIMDADAGMRSNVARDMLSENPEEVRRKSARWLSDAELQVYVDEYGRNGFQGGLNWYKIQTQPTFLSDYEIWSGKKIEVPLAFVAGRSDWGTYQEPGAVGALESGGAGWGGGGGGGGGPGGTHWVEGAGHWVTQERPGECVEVIGRLAREALGWAEGGKNPGSVDVPSRVGNTSEIGGSKM
jgi:pimeloyl-ACP methyl ester carboxylesterase